MKSNLLKFVGILIMSMSLLACAQTPREKLKDAFSDVGEGDTTSEALRKLRAQGLWCNQIDDINQKPMVINGNNKEAPVPDGIVFYQCAAQTDGICLNTGAVRFVSDDNEIVRIVQLIYRTKTCL
uniref:hypothetical protein n=1 Tax=Thaumasiovibrio occultus TaxID=1891184 RepID=UPI000B35F0AB|nr:hypothetical protein [Thaumasiovibrio occultus]